MPCQAPRVVVGGVSISTNRFENAQELIKTVGSDQADPTADEYEGYIALGNNTKGAAGISQDQDPPKQTTLPPPPTTPAKASNDKPPPATVPTPEDCTVWDGVNYDVPVSNHFILRNFTVGYSTPSLNQTRGCLFPNPLIDVVTSAGPCPKQVRFCNIQTLARVVLEPIYQRFGYPRINSAIRNNDTVKPPNISQHMLGEAVDIQFPGWTYEMYWQNAAWVKDNINYDQFIFEHSDSTGLAWYHLSYRRSGSSRPDSTRVMTMFRGKYIPGLKKYF